MSNRVGAEVRLLDIRRGQRLEVVNLERDLLLVRDLRLALGPLGRLRGLLGRPAPAEEEGLLLRPCPGVHTFFMRYPIDVAFLDEEGRIVAARAELGPWRATPLFAACCALELAAGRLQRSGTQLADRLGFFPRQD